MSYEWFKMYSKGWLDGSIRQQLTAEERSVWADLLAFANECRERGVIARAKGIPFTREYLAARFSISLELLNSTIAKCQDDVNDTSRGMAEGHRLEVLADGTIAIGNWEQYQAVPPDKKQLPEDDRERELAARQSAIRGAYRFPDEAGRIVDKIRGVANGSIKSTIKQD